MNNDYLKELGW